MTRNRPHSSSFGVALRAARKAARLTQAQLASKAHVGRDAAGTVEQGQGAVATLSALAAALDLEIGGRSLPPGNHLGERLQVLRKRRKLGRRTVAALAEVSVPAVEGFERSSAGHLVCLEAIGRVLGAGLCLVPRGASPGFWEGAGNSSVHHGWETPSWLLECLSQALGVIDLDPCASSHRTSRVQARVRFTAQDDGLSLTWAAKTVFLNPPYGRELGKWVTKARKEVETGHVRLAVALVPSRSDTRWWHAEIAGRADVWMLKGRLAFGDGMQSAPFPSAIIAWGATPEQRDALSRVLRGAWHIGTGRQPA